MEYSAHVEILSGIVRVFAPGKSYGDPYGWAATLRWVDHESVEYLGALRAPSWEEREAMTLKLREIGVRFVVIKRIKDGREKVAKLDISKKLSQGTRSEPTV